MTSENSKTLTGIYDGWAQGDFTVGISLFNRDATLVMDPELPDAGVYSSVDGIRAYTIRFLEAWDSLTIAAESFKEAGDIVLVKVKQSGTGKNSGAAVGFSYFHLWTFRDGSVIRLESILHEERALEAAGLAG